MLRPDGLPPRHKDTKEMPWAKRTAVARGLARAAARTPMHLVAGTHGAGEKARVMTSSGTGGAGYPMYMLRAGTGGAGYPL
jgi:hypothetical protein